MVEPSLVVASASLAIAIVALFIAWATMRATREAPLASEAMKRHTDQVGGRLSEWVESGPRLPSKDAAHHYPFNHHRKASLWKDWLYVDVITNHPPGGYDDVETAWDRFIELEERWSEGLAGLSRKLEPFIEAQLGLTRPPTLGRVGWEGEVQEEEDELAVDVFWSGLPALLMGELFSKRIQGAFRDSDHPAWDPPYDEVPSKVHIEQGYASEPRDAPVELRWGRGKNATVLAVVSHDNLKKARSIFSPQFVEALHAEFGADAHTLSNIYDEMSAIQARLKQRLEKIAILPLLPGKPCPHVQEALKQ